MLALYLAALVFGLGTFLTQLLFSSAAAGDAPGALDVHPPLDLHIGGHAQASAPLRGPLELGSAAAQPHASSAGGLAHASPPEHDQGPGAPGHDVMGAALGWAGVLFSLRFYMFAAIAFGMVGAPATWLGLPIGSTFGVSLGVGLLAGGLASFGFRAVGRQTLSSGAESSELVGQVGRVLLACDSEHRGKVRLSVRGQTVDYIATTDEAGLAPGTAIIVQEVRPTGLHVCAAPEELLPP